MVSAAAARPQQSLYRRSGAFPPTSIRRSAAGEQQLRRRRRAVGYRDCLARSDRHAFAIGAPARDRIGRRAGTCECVNSRSLLHYGEQSAAAPLQSLRPRRPAGTGVPGVRPMRRPNMLRECALHDRESVAWFWGEFRNDCCARSVLDGYCASLDCGQAATRAHARNTIGGLRRASEHPQAAYHADTGVPSAACALPDR